MLADDRKVDLESARGVLVYRDAASPTRFYYASTRPAIARTQDGYQLTLVRYDKPVDGWAGMLSFVVNLRPPGAEMDSMRRELAARFGAEAQCVPIPWTSGTVAIAVIGGEPVTGKPSLLGDNAAAVSIPLTVDQYLMLRQRKDRSTAAAWAVYGLSFDALRPAYAASIHVDKTALRSWLQKKCSAGLGFISFEKVDTFEDLATSGVLEIRSDSMTGETAPDGFRLSFLRSLQSVLAPLPRFAAAPEAGGGWLVGFDCSTVQDIQQVVQRLDTDMQLTDAVVRQAWIQGELAGLDEALAERPEIELPTGFSFNQALTVRCHDAFGGQPLDTANVQFEPTGPGGGFHSFTRPDEAWTVELTNPPGADTPHVCRCSFHFRDRGSRCGSGTIPVARGQAFLDIVPAAFFTYRRYTVSVAEDFPWDLVDSVSVALSGQPELAFQPDRAVLAASAPEAAIEAFAPAPVRLDDVEYSATIMPARRGIQFSVTGSAAGAAVFLNPFSRRVVTFRAPEGFDWQGVSRIDIAIEARPDGPQLWTKGSLSLTAAAPQARFTYWYTSDKTIRYRARITRNGQATPIPATETVQVDVVLAVPATATHP